MWKRIIYSEWAEIVPYLAFFLTFGVFLILTVRALLMRKSKAKRMAHLPLEEGRVETSDNDRTPNRDESDTEYDKEARPGSQHVHSDKL